MNRGPDTTGPGTTVAGVEPTPGRGFVPEPGDRIGRYIVRDAIAEGGMGMIYTAEDPELGRIVAIKLLHPHLSGSGQEQQQRLQREAQAMAKVSHANLVTVFDVGTHAGQVFIAMEYVVGRTLGQWLGPKRDWRDIVDVFCAAGRGLAAAHKVGLVHRDFKPANVLVADDGVAQVLDFGLVRRAGEADPAADEDDPVLREDSLAIDLTRTGSVMGTPAYMAPEQHLGQATDARSDQFAFCVALYEALYDERPFPGEDAGRVTMAVLENERRPKPKPGAVPDAIYRILDRGLSREPAARYPAMEPLLEELAHQVMRARVAVAGRSRAPWLLVGAIVLLTGVGVAVALRDQAATQEVVEDPTPTGDREAPARARARPALRPATPTPAPAPDTAAQTSAADPGAPAATKPPGPLDPEEPTPSEDPGTVLPGVDEEPLPTVEPEPGPPAPAPEPAPQPRPGDESDAE